MPTLPRHAGYFILFQTKMLGSVHIKFRNKSEYFMTHMLNPTLVKLNMYDLSQLWMNSEWILLDREYIRDISQNNLLLLYLLFFGSISISTFLFKTFFKENTLSLVITFFLYESQVLSSFSLVPSRRIPCKSLSEKTTTKTLSSILYHRWAEIE